MHGLIKLSTRIFLSAVIIIFTTGASAEYYIDPPGSEPCFTCRHRVVRYRTHCCKPCRKRHIVRRHRCPRPPVVIKVIRYRSEFPCDECVSTGCTTCREYDREGAIYSPANCC